MDDNDLEYCDITDEEYEAFIDGNGISPCSDFGDCNNCPFYEAKEGVTND